MNNIIVDVFLEQLYKLKLYEVVSQCLGVDITPSSATIDQTQVLDPEQGLVSCRVTPIPEVVGYDGQATVEWVRFPLGSLSTEESQVYEVHPNDLEAPTHELVNEVFNVCPYNVRYAIQADDDDSLIRYLHLEASEDNLFYQGRAELELKLDSGVDPLI